MNQRRGRASNCAQREFDLLVNAGLVAVTARSRDPVELGGQHPAGALDARRRARQEIRRQKVQGVSSWLAPRSRGTGARPATLLVVVQLT
jgi:hypothetical protein